MDLNRITRSVFTVMLFVCVLIGWSQEVAIYQPEQMQTDLKKFQNLLIKTHPGLFTHQSPQEFEQTMNDLFLETSKPMKATSFYKIVLKLVASIHDGHTDVHAFNELGEHISNQKLFPLEVYVRDERIYIIKNMSTQQISKGSEILSIDGSLSNEIILEILTHFSSDGISDSGMKHSLGVSYRSFNRLYPITYGEKPSYKLTYRDYVSKKIVTTDIKAISKEQYKAKELEKYKYESKKWTKEAFSFEINKSQDYAYLKINRFFKDNFQEPENTYPDYYKKCFKEIFANTIQNLIIDLRNNDGGKGGNAAYLLQYFIDKPLLPTKEITTLGNDEYFLKTTGDTLYLNDDFGLKLKENGTYKVTKSDIMSELKTFNLIKEYPYKGKLIVLIDGGVVSAGGTAAGLLREYTDATFVGSETFGTAGYSNGVQKIYIKGNHTETAISVPLLHADYAIDPSLKKRGIVPDYQISNSIQDLLHDNDAVLEFVFKNLLHSKKD